MIAFLVMLGRFATLAVVVLACLIVAGPEREGIKRGKGM